MKKITNEKKKTILLIVFVLIFSLVVGISIGAYLFNLVNG